MKSLCHVKGVNFDFPRVLSRVAVTTPMHRCQSWQVELRISSADLLRVTDHPTFYISVSKLLVCEHFIYLYVEFSVILIDLSSFQCFIFCNYKEFLISKTIAQVARRYRIRYRKQFASPVTKYIYNDYKILSHERFGKRMLPSVF